MTKGDDGPRYRQIAAELRERIVTGLYGSGTPLPSESKIADEFKASPGTVRSAMDVLRLEGLVVTEHGRASWVRPTTPVRRLGAERYRVGAEQRAGQSARPATSFTHDHGIGWGSYELDREFSEVPAPEDVAALLNLPAGAPLLRRRFVFKVLGAAQQMSTSYLPLEAVAGTAVADPANEPWPGGTIAQLATLGIEVTAVEETVRARMPTADERRELKAAGVTPVVTITRVMLAGDRPVEAAVDIVIPADRVELHYRIDL